ncbi:MAG: hypothetical protein DSY33_02455 [Archaeoglobus sp.]|jgi:hypothetical protein|nr:MAG: hypothetical protein DSY33_02455 [Archaeoglobus sp.]
MSELYGKDVKDVIEKFEGLVDEETLKLLALYAMGKIKLRGEVKKIRLYLSPERAIVDLKLHSRIGIESCRALLRGELLRYVPRLSCGSVVSVSGVFAGEMLKVDELNVIKQKRKVISGLVVAVKDRVISIVNEGKCLSCYNLSRSNVEEGQFVSMIGVEADRDIFVAESISEEENKLNSFDFFKPISKISSFSGRICIKGRISGIGELRKLRGREYASIHVSDNSGRVKLMLWNDLYVYRNADIGDPIQVFSCRADGNTLHCDEFTILKLV